MVEILKSFWLWVASGSCHIKDRRGKLVPLVPNRIQRRLFEAMMRQALAGMPIRIIVLKARKLGASTLVEALGYFLARYRAHWMSAVVAHSADSTNEIFGITKRVHRFNPDKLSVENAGSRKELAFGHDSKFVAWTAGGPHVGSASTLNLLHLSELPKWTAQATGVEDQLASLLNAVPDDPETVVVIEATASRIDSTGEFQKRWLRAEAGSGGYAPVFSAWFDEDAYTARCPLDFVASPEEQELARRFELSNGQLQWYRLALYDKCNGSLELRRQEYPSTPEEAFQVASGRIFPMLRAERHLRRLDCSDWMLYRGLDWGGSHPFVCVWAAYMPGEPGFTVDGQACPRLWESLTQWSRDDKGKVREQWKDACDAARYVVATYALTGWVHFYRELWVDESARMSLSELDLAKRIVQMSGREVFSGSVADRSRPSSIQLFCQLGVPCVAKPAPLLGANRVSEIEDEVTRMQALMVGTVRMHQEPRALTPEEHWLRARKNMPVRVARSENLTRVDLSSESRHNPFGHEYLARTY